MGAPGGTLVPRPSIAHVGTDQAYAAVVLAGGGGRRLGGRTKPALPVAGRPMLHRVLAAVADAAPRVVVGPPGLPLPPGTVRTQERPPGGGPVPATAAGLAQVPAGIPYVALLAADLPVLTTAAVTALRRALAGTGADGAVFVDDTGRRQWLCGVWRAAPLREALSGGRAGALGAVLGGLAVTGVRAERGVPPPWFDCDTDADLRIVEEWVDGDAG